MKHQEPIGRFIENLRSPNLEMRMKAIKRLGELQNEEAVEPLVQTALNYQGPYSEFEEIRDVLLLFPRLSVHWLIRALETEDMGYRGYAVQLLGYFKDDAALESLLNILDEDTDDTKWAVPGTLAAYGEKITDQLFERVLAHSNPTVRRTAMKTLSLITSARVAQFAEQHLDNRVVQQEIIDALGNPHTVENMEHRLALIIPFLESKRSATRLAAALPLGKLGDERAVEALVNHLNDPDSTTRLNIIAALGWIGSSKAVEPLIEQLGDEAVRQSIAEALGKIGDERAIAVLLAVRDTSNYITRYQINEALKKLSHLPADFVHEPMTDHEKADARQRLIDITTSLLDHPNPENRAIYIQSLMPYKDEKIALVLVSHSEVETDPTVKQALANALSEIRESQNPDVQRLINEALQRLDPS